MFYKLTKLILLPLFLAVSSTNIFAYTSKTANVLVKQAGDVKVAYPSAQASVETAIPLRSQVDSDVAHGDWLKAKNKFATAGYHPKNTQRLDVSGAKLVMLQGFHWYADSHWLNVAGGWWSVVTSKAAEIGRAGFNLVWLPPASQGSYYPTELYNLKSQWGDKGGLKRAVNALHSANVYVLADAVLNHRNGTKDWYDFTNPDWPTTVIVQNDEWRGFPGQPNNGKSGNYDQGQNEGGCRDIDHSQKIVQDEYITFMRWLRDEIGVDGFRYDMVKGFDPYYVGLYNRATLAAFSVGEYFDGNKQLLVNWIDGTDSSSGKTNASTIFDFTTHFNILSAAETDNYGVLNDNGRPSGLIGWWPAKSVTFVENHDTSPRDPSFIANATQEYKIQRMVGYAYILTHPGIPCVFWAHYFDWGDAYKQQINNLIAIRKRAGISSDSRMGIMQSTNGLYAAVIDGDYQRVVVKLGKSWGWQPGEGWQLAASGERYAVWTQNR